MYCVVQHSKVSAFPGEYISMAYYLIHPIPVKSAEITTIAHRNQNETEQLGSHHKLNLASN